MSLVVGLGLFAYSRGLYYYVQFFFDDLYGEVLRFGDDCSVAIGDWQVDDDFAKAAARPLATSALAMPYRTAAPEKKPKVGKDQYLLTRCMVDLTKLEAGSFGWMRLHFVHGESAIYLNGTLRQSLGDLGVGEFPVLPEDRRSDATLVVVSRPNELKHDRLGLPTGMPLIMTGRRAALSLPNLGGLFDFVLRPAFWVNWSLVFLFVFGVAWVGGLRSADIGWVVVAMASNAVMNVALFSVENSYTPTMGVVSRVAVMATHLAFACFAWTFVKRRSEWGPFLLFVVGVGAYATLNVVPQSMLTLTHVALDVPAWTQIVAYGFVAVVGFRYYRTSTTEMAKRSMFVLSFCAMLAVARAAHLAVYYTTNVTFVEILTELGMTGFCGFLVYDLVVYHRRYLQERVAHADSRVRARELEAIAQTTQMLAHDVRKPFSVLKLATEQLKQAKDPDTFRRLADDLGRRIERDRKRTEELLADVMEVGGERSYTARPTRVADLVTEAIEATGLASSMRRVIVIKELMASQWPLLDRPRFQRVLVNLLDNAHHATKVGGTVTVASRDLAGGKIALSVRNTDSFVAEADRERLFEPFFSKGKEGGTGLGLAVVRRIVQGHGGSIRCDSDKHGTTFVMTLPAAAAPTQKTHPERLKVAFVEDDVFVTEAWIGRLGADLELSTFASPKAFRSAVDAGASFDFVVTDFYFDGDPESGADLLRWIREKLPGVKVALASELGASELGEASFDAHYGKEPPPVARLLDDV